MTTGIRVLIGAPAPRFRVVPVMLSILVWAASALAVNNGDVPINTPDSARRMILDLSKHFGYLTVLCLSSFSAFKDAQLDFVGSDLPLHCSAIFLFWQAGVLLGRVLYREWGRR